MKVLIIGKGGREHALAWKVKQSPLVTEVFVAPGNVGIEDCTLVPIHDDNILRLADFAEQEKIDLTIVGPESCLAIGLVDLFEKRGLKIFGPSQAAAQIESSKDFAKKLMHKYNVPTSEYKTFDDKQKAIEYLNTRTIPIVIKEDGLRAGKGVTVALTREGALEALENAFSEPNRVVIEDYLDGFEFSLIALANGEDIIALEVAQDHKRAFDNDEGPNTGGMGVYSPVDKITPSIVQDTIDLIMKPMLKGMKAEGMPFKGFLFAGIMLTDKGVKTIEFNARFGDPEAEGILPRMKTDLVEVILNILDHKITAIEWDNRYTVAVVMASENYPYSSTIGAEVEIPEDIESYIFHMGTKKEDDKLLTAGGRVLAVVAYGDTLEEAQKNVYNDVQQIKSEKLFYRKDIGAKMCYDNDKNKI